MGQITPPYWQDERGIWHFNIGGNLTPPGSGTGGGQVLPYSAFDYLAQWAEGIENAQINIGSGDAGGGFGLGLGNLTAQQRRALLYLLLAGVLGVTLIATKGKVRLA